MLEQLSDVINDAINIKRTGSFTRFVKYFVSHLLYFTVTYDIRRSLCLFILDAFP